MGQNLSIALGGMLSSFVLCIFGFWFFKRLAHVYYIGPAQQQADARARVLVPDRRGAQHDAHEEPPAPPPPAVLPRRANVMSPARVVRAVSVEADDAEGSGSS